ncbi:MAG TPA: zf-HC2 domain-containing protein [Verrucomicrobiae bacterium]|nr:zf-HC2 domain-containing protein [Verrucomicrobiae bacterium]
MRSDLSAYVDDELTPTQRAAVEAHLASCPGCQQELEDLKALGTHLAALPIVPPAPQFVADVRRKIARGYKTETPTWYAHFFEPFWLKVPLETAALIVIAILVFRPEVLIPARKDVSFQLAKVQGPVGHPPAPPPHSMRWQQAIDEFEIAERVKAERSAPRLAEPAAPVSVAPPSGTPEKRPLVQLGQSLESRNEVVASRETGVSNNDADKEKRSYVAMVKTAPRPDSPVGGPAAQGGEMVGLLGDSTGNAGRPRLLPSFPGAATVARDFGIEISSLGDVVVVHAGDIREVQDRAGKLAAQCQGRLLPILQPSPTTGQVFLVELPRQYAGSFKSALQQKLERVTVADNSLAQAESANALNDALTSNQPAATDAGKTRRSETTTLEILVVKPAH